jgi:nitrite reductase/ring-hydroxylating ferredoxin subunit
MSRVLSTSLSVHEQAERAMRHSWFPVARSVDVTDAPVQATLLGEKLAVFRGADGLARVTANRCPHRGGSLGHGKVQGNNIACPYLGWQFSGDGGKCALVPSCPTRARSRPGRPSRLTRPRNASVTSGPCWRTRRPTCTPRLAGREWTTSGWPPTRSHPRPESRWRSRTSATWPISRLFTRHPWARPHHSATCLDVRRRDSARTARPCTHR